MITSVGEKTLDLRGLSTDVPNLPTENIGNGSTFFCVNNGDVYAFDAESKQWNKI